MGGLIELLIVLLIFGVIYQMFNSKGAGNPYTKDKEQHIQEINKHIPVEVEEKPIIEKKKGEVLLGQTVNSLEDFYITSKELNAMCLVVGATGAGKTECIKTLLEDGLLNNQPIIIVDGKGDPKFPNEYKALCDKYNRNFKLFTCNASESLNFNPLRHGEYTELKDKLISLFDFSEEYYKQQAERFLQGVLKVLLLRETKELLGYEVIDLQILIKTFNIEFMQNLIEQLEGKADFMNSILEEADKKAINGFAGRLKTIVESELGELFKDTQDSKTIDLFEDIQNNNVVFFSLNSLKFAEYSKMLGRLVIADLKTVAPRFAGADKEIFTVFDEFNVFASEIIVNLINKTRAYGFRNIMGTQELADMIINGDDKLLKQIWGNTNVKIALRQDVYESQETLAKGVGTRDIYKPTVTSSPNSEFNTVSVELREEYFYKERDFGNLQNGQAIAFIKVPEIKHGKIKIRMVE